MSSKIGMFLGIICLSACAGGVDSQAGVTSSSTAGQRVVSGLVSLVDVGKRLARQLSNEEIELRVAHVALGQNGQPVAYAGGVPLMSCEGAPAIDRATSDEAGRYAFKAVAAGDFCAAAGGSMVSFHVDDDSPDLEIQPLVIDLNQYGSTCVLAQPVPNVPASCLVDRDFVGATCYCQTGISAYSSGTISADG
jgi:hypothetical protein